MNADQLLNELGLTMGLPNLRFDEHGCARLMFDGKTAIDLEADSETGMLQVYSVLSPLPAEGRETTFLSLLEGNLFGTQTHGATLAVDSLYNEVLLCRTVDTEQMSGASFATMIERFVDSVETWKERIEGMPAEQDRMAFGGESVPVGEFIRG